jgi:hypothetical protein
MSDQPTLLRLCRVQVTDVCGVHEQLEKDEAGMSGWVKETLKSEVHGARKQQKNSEKLVSCFT